MAKAGWLRAGFALGLDPQAWKYSVSGTPKTGMILETRMPQSSNLLSGRHRLSPQHGSVSKPIVPLFCSHQNSWDLWM